MGSNINNNLYFIGIVRFYDSIKQFGFIDTNMFGKTLSAMIGDELSGKLSHMPQDARDKVSELLERIMNEGSGSMICILL